MSNFADHHPPPRPADPEALAELLRALREAGLTEAAVVEVEKVVPRQADAVRAPAVRHALSARSDAAAPLLALLLYDTPVDTERVHAAIGADCTQTLVSCGLVREEGSQLVPVGRVVPFLGVYIAGDRPDTDVDAVMPPGPTTQEIGASLPSEFDGRVLDVATGPGSLAIVAAARGARVVGTDLSERALAFARFNAAFNGVEVDWRAGSLLAPVAGEEFDLVVAQPPFVPRPPALANMTFAHGGAEGDELAFELLRGVRAVLDADGIALVRFDAPRRPTTLVELVRAAVGGDGADIVVLNWPGPSALHEAVMFAGLADRSLGDAYVDGVDQYAAHLDELGIVEFVQALAIVRANDGVSWTAGLPTLAAPGSWVAVASYVYALDAAGSPDDVLASTRVAPNPGVLVGSERVLGTDPETSALEVRRGAIAAARPVDAETLTVLDSFGGGHTPASVAEALQEITGVEPVVARTTVLAVVREALAAGHLVVA